MTSPRSVLFDVIQRYIAEKGHDDDLDMLLDRGLEGVLEDFVRTGDITPLEHRQVLLYAILEHEAGVIRDILHRPKGGA